MSAHDFLKRLHPDDVLKVRTVLKLLEDAAPKAILSTVEAAALFGYSDKSWLQWCQEGEVWGLDASGKRWEAWQDAEGAPWRLPRVACEARIARLHTEGSRRKEGLRGPRVPAPHRTLAQAS